MSNRRPWVKLWADCLDSRQLAKAGEAAEVVFYRLLALNGTDGAGDLLPLSAEDIAWRMRLPEADLLERLAALEAVGLIERTEAGIRFSGWSERQAEISDAERARLWRQRKREQPERSQNVHRTFADERDEQSCRILESESELELEEEARTQPPVVERIATPVPTAATRVVKPAATDEPLRALLDAWNTATGDRLVWSAKYFQPTEQAYFLGATPELLTRAAKAYTAALDTGARSFPRFCGDFDRWISAANAPPKPKPARGRDDHRLGAPSQAARTIWSTPESELTARSTPDEF